jgi:hypothetical protein
MRGQAAVLDGARMSRIPPPVSPPVGQRPVWGRTPAGLVGKALGQTRQSRARWLAAAALLALALSALAVATGTGSPPWQPADRLGFEKGALAGPLAGLGPHLSPRAFAALVGVMLASYLIIVALGRRLPSRLTLAVLVALVVAFTLAPPLLSSDSFLYLTHARLGGLHSLNPYTDVPADAPGDPALALTSHRWHDKPSIYGPLFTAFTYALVPLGLVGGLWSLKAVAGVASLGLVAIVWRCAHRLGRDPVAAVAFVGLNPLLLVWVVGGAHNDAVLALLVAASVHLLIAVRPKLAGASLAAACAVKATAALLVPFAVLQARPRLHVLLGLVTGLLAVLAVSLLVFGGEGTIGIATSLNSGQAYWSPQSVPYQVSALAGARSVPDGVGPAGSVIAAVAVALVLWRVWRGKDWIAGAGYALLAVFVATLWLRPWYVAWLLPLAALGNARWLRLGTLVLTAFLVLGVPLGSPLEEPLRLLLSG